MTKTEDLELNDLGGGLNRDVSEPDLGMSKGLSQENLQTAQIEGNRKKCCGIAWSKRNIIIAVIVAVLVATGIALGLYFGIRTALVAAEADEPDLPPWTFETINGIDYHDRNIYETFPNIPNVAACQAKCIVGCDLFSYIAATSTCHLIYIDKIAHAQTVFTNTKNDNFFPGDLSYANVIRKVAASDLRDCKNQCSNTAGCHAATFLPTTNNDEYTKSLNGLRCTLRSFKAAPGVTLGFITNPYAINANPNRRGKFEVIGNSGVVAINAHLLPSGKVLFTARPEYARGGKNPDAFLRNSVPYGEIVSLYDPMKRQSRATPIPIDENLFCNGAVLLADGRLFASGGDNTGDIGRDNAIPLGDGLRVQRIFDEKLGRFVYDGLPQMKEPRWYPSPIRLTDGRIYSFGGATDG
jgi:hypothetical protein